MYFIQWLAIHCHFLKHCTPKSSPLRKAPSNVVIYTLAQADLVKVNHRNTSTISLRHSEVFRDFIKTLVRHQKLTVFWPQKNGKIERYVQPLVKVIH